MFGDGWVDGFLGLEPGSMDDDYLNGYFRGCEVREKEEEEED